MRRLSGIIVLIVMVSAAASCRPGKAVTTHPDGIVIDLSDSLIGASAADTIQLGRMREGEVVVAEFSLRNADSIPFVITNLTTTCGCATFEFNREPVMPGKEKQVVLRFDSGGLYGDVVKKASLHTSFRGGVHNIYIEATVE